MRDVSRAREYPSLVKLYREKLVRRNAKYLKKVLFALRRPAGESIPAFILGCGRSGTSMLLNHFERHMSVEVLGENDPRIASNYMLDHSKIEPTVARSKASIVVMKPILNSFDAARILDRYDRARVIWMLRGYRDVVASANRRFGSTVAGYLRELIESGVGGNWLSAGLPAASVSRIRGLATERFTDNDWMALVWWSVNMCVLRQHLYARDRFLLLEYEKLVQDAESTMGRVYEFLGLTERPVAWSHVHPGSVGKGAGITLECAVEEMCDDLYEDISKQFRRVEPRSAQ